MSHLSNRSWQTQHEASRLSSSVFFFMASFSPFLPFFLSLNLFFSKFFLHLCFDWFLFFFLFCCFRHLHKIFLVIFPSYYSSFSHTQSQSWHVQQNLRWMEMLTRWWWFHTSSTDFTALLIFQNFLPEPGEICCHYSVKMIYDVAFLLQHRGTKSQHLCSI